jgi:ATP phosphoribosyltransferase regulatory subunit
MLDLSMVGHQDYYTGLIFRGYAVGSGWSVLDGGRYDKLLSQFVP